MEVLYDVIKEVGDVSSIMDDVLAKKPGDRFDIYRIFVEEVKKAGCLPNHRSVTEWQTRLTEAYSQMCEDRIVAAPEIPGSEMLLQKLAKEKVPVYLNSATPEEAVQIIIHKRGWDKYFSRVMGGPRSKEDNLDFVLNKEGLEPSEVIFVGDTEPDRAAAEKMTIPYIGLESEYSKYKMTLMNKVKNLKELL